MEEENGRSTALRKTRAETGYFFEDLILHENHTKTVVYGQLIGGHVKEVKYWLAELRDASKKPTLNSNKHDAFVWLPKDGAIAKCAFAEIEELLNHFHDIIPTL